MSVERYSGAFSIQTVESYFENQAEKPPKKQDSAEILYKIKNNNLKKNSLLK